MGPVRLLTGKWRYRGFHWHAYSAELCPAESGSQALLSYEAEAPGPLIVIPESWREAPALRVSGKPPDLTAIGFDLYVFPESLVWSIAFTHEPGYGPYFSRAEWCPSAAQPQD